MEDDVDLILWRHAEAEEGGAAVADHKRRLTVRGEKQAKKVAHWLQQHLPRKRRILVSPTERTQQTAHALELPYELEPKVGVDATVADILSATHWPEQSGAVLVIGHQPSLGRLAALLISGEQADWPIKKGALWWLSGRMRKDESQTVLRTVIHPDFL
jgi:phosphohistidine phosphatase